MIYVNYRFSDYAARKDRADEYNDYMDPENTFNRYFREKGNGLNLIEQMDSRIGQAAIDSGSVDLFNGLIEVCGSGQKFGDAMQKAWETQGSKYSSAETPKQMLNDVISTENAKDIERKANELVTTCQESFSNRLKDISISLGNLLQNGETLQSYANALIQEYITKKNITDNNEVASAIMQDVLRSGGIKKLNINDGVDSMGIAYEQAVLLLASIGAIDGVGDIGEFNANDTYKVSHSRGSKNGKDYAKTELLEQIALKLNGFLTNIKGDFGEIAWMKAALEGTKEVYEELSNISYELSSNNKAGSVTSDCVIASSVEAKVTGNEQIDTLEGKKVSKGDVMLNFKNGGIELAIGYSIKDYTVNPSSATDNISNISLVHGTSFLEAYNRMIGNSESLVQYLYNVAGGRKGKGYTKEGKKRDYSEEDLTSRWQNIVTSTSIANFLNALVGFEQEHYNYSNGALTIFLVVNGQIYSISEILKNIQLNNIRGGVFMDNSKAAVNRSKFYTKNVWISFYGKEKRSTKVDNKLGQERSESVVNSIYSILNSVRLQITVNNLLEIIK